MADPALDDRRIREEAAAWFARLNSTMVSTETLREFRAWRRDSQNAQAYADIERFWRHAELVRQDPQIQDAADQAMNRKKRGPRGLARPGPKSLATLAIIAALGLLLALGWPTLTARVYATDVGELRLVRLEDGSRLQLDTASKVRVRMDQDARRVDLIAGRAQFAVAHDPQRPFIVHADGAEVRALGTRFDVRRAAAAVEVTLLEGVVRVTGEAADKAWTLAPGEQLKVGPGADRKAPAPVSAETWTSGRLVFRGAPLAEAVAEVNRYSPRKIVLEAPGLARTPVTGVFDAGDTAAFVAAVQDLYDLEAVEDGRRAVRLRPRA